MRLGLIAMSGVRVQNQELMKLGLTLPGFIERSKVIASLPSLGLLTLAGMTTKEFDVEYIEVPDLNAIEGLPAEFDLVAISSFTAQIKDAYTLADRYRDAGTKVVLGGLHVTALPEEAALHADSIVIGEGEVSWPRLIDDLRHKTLKPVYDGRGHSFDLAEAPMPRFELLHPDRYNRLTVQTQRGCPFRCEFCASSIRLSPTYKIKPVKNVISEIQRIKSIWSQPFIEFADDNTFANPSHGKRLLRALTKENIRWFTETDISVAEDGELLALLRDSGCAQLLIGFESPVRQGLDGLEQRSNWKAKQVDRYLAAIEKIQGHGITVNGCFVLGLDGSDASSFHLIPEFVQQSSLYDVQVTIQTPFPGTPLYKRLHRQGRLIQAGAWERCTLFDVNFRPQNMTVAELEQYFHQLVATLYSKENTDQRHRAFFKQRRMNQHQTGQLPHAVSQ